MSSYMVACLAAGLQASCFSLSPHFFLTALPEALATNKYIVSNYIRRARVV